MNTLEGEICKIADIVAYINHDIGDAIRANIITERDLPLSAVKVLGISHSQRINTMVGDIIDNSWAVRGCDKMIIERLSISMSPQILEGTNILREFLFERVYKVQSAEEEAKRARETIGLLYSYLREHEDRLPAEYRTYSDDAERRIVDYIAGMTDQYALRLAKELEK